MNEHLAADAWKSFVIHKTEATAELFDHADAALKEKDEEIERLRMAGLAQYEERGRLERAIKAGRDEWRLCVAELEKADVALKDETDLTNFWQDKTLEERIAHRRDNAMWVWVSDQLWRGSEDPQPYSAKSHVTRLVEQWQKEHSET